MSRKIKIEDLVKYPKHYCFSKFEPKDIIREWGLNFNLGNAVKYIARAGRKDDAVLDLQKAQEYIQFEIDAIKGERKTSAPEHTPHCKHSIQPIVDEIMRSLAEGNKEQIKQEVKKVHEMINDPEPKCTLNPVFADLEDDTGVCVGTLEVTMPAGADPEDIIKAVIEKLYGGE